MPNDDSGTRTQVISNYIRKAGYAREQYMSISAPKRRGYLIKTQGKVWI